MRSHKLAEDPPPPVRRQHADHRDARGRHASAPPGTTIRWVVHAGAADDPVAVERGERAVELGQLLVDRGLLGVGARIGEGDGQRREEVIELVSVIVRKNSRSSAQPIAVGRVRRSSSSASSPTVSPGRSATARTASRTPGMNAERSIASWRIDERLPRPAEQDLLVRDEARAGERRAPVTPSIVAAAGGRGRAGRLRERTTRPLARPRSRRAVASAVPLGASELPVVVQLDHLGGVEVPGRLRREPQQQHGAEREVRRDDAVRVPPSASARSSSRSAGEIPVVPTTAWMPVRRHHRTFASTADGWVKSTATWASASPARRADASIGTPSARRPRARDRRRATSSRSSAAATARQTSRPSCRRRRGRRSGSRDGPRAAPSCVPGPTTASVIGWDSTRSATPRASSSVTARTRRASRPA